MSRLKLQSVPPKIDELLDFWNPDRPIRLGWRIDEAVMEMAFVTMIDTLRGSYAYPAGLSGRRPEQSNLLGIEIDVVLEGRENDDHHLIFSVDLWEVYLLEARNAAGDPPEDTVRLRQISDEFRRLATGIDNILEGRNIPLQNYPNRGPTSD